MSAGTTNVGGALASPATGRALPMYDEAANERVVAAHIAFESISIPYARQQAIMARIDALRLSTLGRRGTPLPGLRLSQISQSGKTFTLRSYMLRLKADTAARGLEPNPHQIVYIGLKRRVTVKMLYQRLLLELGDPHTNVGNVEILTQRAEEFITKLGVELLIVDEVQHLANRRSESSEVTDELKAFLDAGLVPVVFAGNEESRRFFEENNQLAARLGAPLELSPIDLKTKSEAVLFKSFCMQLDDALVRSGATRELSQLGQGHVIRGLLISSGGHVGRVCRIVESALEYAVRRNADFIESYDFFYAVENLAIPSQWVNTNPFARQS